MIISSTQTLYELLQDIQSHVRYDGISSDKDPNYITELICHDHASEVMFCALLCDLSNKLGKLPVEQSLKLMELETK